MGGGTGGLLRTRRVRRQGPCVSGGGGEGVVGERVCMHACMYACIHVVRVCMGACVYQRIMYACMLVYHVHVYVYMYVSI